MKKKYNVVINENEYAFTVSPDKHKAFMDKYGKYKPTLNVIQPETEKKINLYNPNDPKKSLMA